MKIIELSSERMSRHYGGDSERIQLFSNTVTIEDFPQRAAGSPQP